MTSHALVESLAAVDVVRSQAAGPITWHATSPAVIETLRRAGETAIWADRAVPAHWPTSIGLAAVETARELEDQIKAVCTDLGVPTLATAVCQRLAMTLAVLGCKRAQLERFYANPGTRIVAGSARLSPVRNGELHIGMFDTLFSPLSVDLDVLRAECETGDIRSLMRQVDEMILSDRLLSLLDLSPTNVVSRLLRFVARGRGLRLGQAGRTVLIGQENETIREMLPHLLKAGATLRPMPAPSPVAAGEPRAGLPDRQAIAAVLSRALRRKSVEIGTETIAAIAAARLSEASRWWRPIVQEADRLATTSTATLSRPPAVLTNTISSVAQVALAERLRQRGAMIVVAEHGVSVGLSHLHEPLRPWSEASLADLYLACSRGAVAFFRADERHARVDLVDIGLAAQTRRVPLRSLQGAVGRRRLRVARRERVIMYLARSVQNNTRKIAYALEDHREHAIQLAIMQRVLPRLRGLPVVKLYPTTRYLDPYEVPDTLSGTPIRVLKAGDFRYLRSAVDLIVLSSPLSTLGWAFGADRPLFFLEDRQSPLLADVRSALSEAVFYFDIGDEAWPERLVASLNRSDDEIALAWSDKAAARARFLEHHVFGPENAGARGARALLQRLDAAQTKCTDHDDRQLVGTATK